METGDTGDSMEETEESTPESYDSYLTAQVLLSQGGEPMKATVVGWTGYHDGRPLGKRHDNPSLDTVDNKGRSYYVFGKLLNVIEWPRSVKG